MEIWGQKMISVRLVGIYHPNDTLRQDCYKVTTTVYFLKLKVIDKEGTCSALVKVESSGMSDFPLASNWRERSRVLYSLSLTFPRTTRYGSFGGICFQNSVLITHVEKKQTNQKLFINQINRRKKKFDQTNLKYIKWNCFSTEFEYSRKVLVRQARNVSWNRCHIAMRRLLTFLISTFWNILKRRVNKYLCSVSHIFLKMNEVHLREHEVLHCSAT